VKINLVNQIKHQLIHHTFLLYKLQTKSNLLYQTWHQEDQINILERTAKTSTKAAIECCHANFVRMRAN
jgi:hypothetical protein